MKKLTIILLAMTILVATNFNTQKTTKGVTKMQAEQVQTLQYFYDLQDKSTKIKSVSIIHDEVTKYNIYIVTDKNNKVEVISADTTKKEAPEKVKKIIEELKKVGFEKQQTRFFNLIIIWW